MLWSLKEELISRIAQGPSVGNILMKPEHSGSIFYNYKDLFPVVLMAVADLNYRSVYVDISRCGKDYDSTIFKRSTLWTSIQKNKLKLPIERPLSGTKAQMYHTSL